MHAIAIEAERRGWQPEASTASENGYGDTVWSPVRDGHFTIQTPDYRLIIRLQEKGVKSRGSWEIEVERARRWSQWNTRDRDAPSGRYDAEGTGQLQLQIAVTHEWDLAGRQHRWSDGQSQRIEDRLSALFHEIEGRVLLVAREKERRRRAAADQAERERLAAEQRRRLWEQHVAAARQQFVEAHRVAYLHEQTERWHHIEAIRQYCAAAGRTHGRAPETAAFLAWAEGYVAANDPLATPPTLSNDLQPTEEQLDRYMPAGWTAKGPDAQPRRHHPSPPSPAPTDWGTELRNSSGFPPRHWSTRARGR
ncbi:MAG: hypothetical protein JHD02_10435 [Thermoleophilaceae bacterium]|nr:hypothetical protein [Thermoleophilaceae bacterium]